LSNENLTAGPAVKVKAKVLIAGLSNQTYTMLTVVVFVMSHNAVKS